MGGTAILWRGERGSGGEHGWRSGGGGENVGLFPCREGETNGPQLRLTGGDEGGGKGGGGPSNRTASSPEPCTLVRWAISAPLRAAERERCVPNTSELKRSGLQSAGTRAPRRIGACAHIGLLRQRSGVEREEVGIGVAYGAHLAVAGSPAKAAAVSQGVASVKIKKGRNADFRNEKIQAKTGISRKG